MNVKVKKLHKNAIIPFYAKDGDAGLDLTAVSVEQIGDNIFKYGFGLAFEIPKGYVGYVFPRSSVYKVGMILSNCVGVIDSGYRGEVSAVFGDLGGVGYSIGDRIAQLIIMPIPKINLVESDNLEDSERGSGGYGSSGR